MDLPDLEPKAVSLGNFDGIHLGHQKLMAKNISISKKYNLEPSVLLFKENTKKTLNHENSYLTSLEDKIEILSQLGIKCFCLIDFDEKFMNLSPREFIDKIISKKLNSKYVIIGDDYRFGKKARGSKDTLKEFEEDFSYKTEIVEFEYENEHEKISSNHIRSFVKDGEISKANKYLGRAYKINGKVVHGAKRGRKMNFPTANLEMNFNYVLPVDGVYLTRAIVNDKKHYALTNIGKNPTFDYHKTKIETHILDFNEDIYGCDFSIEFLEFFRYDIKFDSVEELIYQMNLDKEKAYEYINSL